MSNQAGEDAFHDASVTDGDHRRFRVLIVDQNASVPFDRRVWNESCALRDGGYDVTVICAEGEGRDLAPHEFVDGVDIWRFPVIPARHGLDYSREYGVSLYHIRRLA